MIPILTFVEQMDGKIATHYVDIERVIDCECEEQE